MNDHKLVITEKTPFKKILSETRKYVTSKYGVDDDTFEQLKPLVKKFYRTMLKKQAKNNKASEMKAKPQENEKNKPEEDDKKDN